jgi:hypothetical protein
LILPFRFDLAAQNPLYHNKPYQNLSPFLPPSRVLTYQPPPPHRTVAAGASISRPHLPPLPLCLRRRSCSSSSGIETLLSPPRLQVSGEFFPTQRLVNPTDLHNFWVRRCTPSRSGPMRVLAFLARSARNVIYPHNLIPVCALLYAEDWSQDAGFAAERLSSRNPRRVSEAPGLRTSRGCPVVRRTSDAETLQLDSSNRGVYACVCHCSYWVSIQVAGLSSYVTNRSWLCRWAEF